MTETRHETRIPQKRGGFPAKEYAHVVFRTAQPEALIDWYCKVLGMQVVLRHPAISFLTWDGSQDRLAVISEPNAPVPAPNSAGFHHAAYEVENLRELIGQYRALKKQGITPEQCLNHGVATSMYYRDPDHNLIELTVGSFKTVDDLNAWLATGALDINPLGVFLDPEELAARVDSGEPEEEILKPHPQHTEVLPDLPRGQPLRNPQRTEERHRTGKGPHNDRCSGQLDRHSDLGRGRRRLCRLSRRWRRLPRRADVYGRLRAARAGARHGRPAGVQRVHRAGAQRLLPAGAGPGDHFAGRDRTGRPGTAHLSGHHAADLRTDPGAGHARRARVPGLAGRLRAHGRPPCRGDRVLHGRAAHDAHRRHLSRPDRGRRRVPRRLPGHRRAQQPAPAGRRHYRRTVLRPRRQGRGPAARADRAPQQGPRLSRRALSRRGVRRRAPRLHPGRLRPVRPLRRCGHRAALARTGNPVRSHAELSLAWTSRTRASNLSPASWA